MKKTRIKRKSKSTIRKVQDELWQLCREMVFRKWGNNCYTCGAKDLVGANRQCGHLWPKAALSAFLKYDVRVLRPQCFHCNINLGGNGAVFYKRVLADEGPEFMEQLERDRLVIVKAIDHYQQLIPMYREILESHGGLIGPSSSSQ